MARPTRPQPHRITWLRSPSMRLSIRRLSMTAPRWPSTISSSPTVSVYSAVPTPARIRMIVNTWPAPSSGSTSLKPTVVIVVTVW